MSSIQPKNKEKDSWKWTEKDYAELERSLFVSGWIIAGNLTAASIAIYFWPTILLGESIIDKIIFVLISITSFAGILWVLVYVLSRKEVP